VDFLNLRNNPLKFILIGLTFVAGLGVATGISAASGNTTATFLAIGFLICLENNCMAYTCLFYSWDAVRAVAILIITSFFNSFYIVISYKDNDFIPSIDIYSKVNITMAIYKRRHFSAE
jgi:hypothetical protein